MKDYILKRFNPYLKSKLEFSNLESLDNDKTSLLYNHLDVNFNLLTHYIYSQQSFNDFVKSENMKITQKLNFIRTRYYLSFETLKLLVKANKSEWNKLPDKTIREHLLLLEKFGLIMTKNFSEFKIINKNIMTFI